jgi:hypothetical protein
VTKKVVGVFVRFRAPSLAPALIFSVSTKSGFANL